MEKRARARCNLGWKKNTRLHSFSLYRTCVYILQMHARLTRTFLRTHLRRKEPSTHGEGVRICVHKHARRWEVQAGERDLEQRVPDWFGSPKPPTPPTPRHSSKGSERGRGRGGAGRGRGCRGYRPGFSAGKSRRGRVFTQDTTIHYVIELNEASSPSFSAPLALSPLPAGRSANVYACECSGTRVRGVVCPYASEGVERPGSAEAD